MTEELERSAVIGRVDNFDGKMSQSTETTHDELWEVTFEAAVPAGIRGSWGATSAEEVLVQKWTQVLRSAGVPFPKVRVRKLATSGGRGVWKQFTPYSQGDIVIWHEQTWVATKDSENRKPGTISAKGYWAPADELKELPSGD